jgi:hypothetical protein
MTTKEILASLPPDILAHAGSCMLVTDQTQAVLERESAKLERALRSPWSGATAHTLSLGAKIPRIMTAGPPSPRSSKPRPRAPDPLNAARLLVPTMALVRKRKRRPRRSSRSGNVTPKPVTNDRLSGETFTFALMKNVSEWQTWRAMIHRCTSERCGPRLWKRRRQRHQSLSALA